MSSRAILELQLALLEIGRAAERLKTYDLPTAESLRSVIIDQVFAIGQIQGLPRDLRTISDRIVVQGEALIDSMARARQYPKHIIARADVLDRTGRLAKMTRDLLADLGALPMP